jgi:hypothetical protein
MFETFDEGFSRKILLAGIFFVILPLHIYCATIYQNPLQLSSYNLVFTKIQINGRETLALIDSGSFRTVEISSTLARELKITLTETQKIARRYEGKDFYLKSGQANIFKIGDYQKQNVEVTVVEGDIENISKQVKTNFEVILGWGFLSQFEVVVDFKNLLLKFSDSPIKVSGEKFRINYAVINGVPLIKGIIDEQTINLLFDTGAPMCNLDASLTVSAKGEKILKPIIIDKSKLSLEWRVKDLSVIKKSLDCAGVIGNNFLNQFAVYFDNQNKIIHLY